MRRALALFCGASLLILSAHRLPAPIQEVPQTTPTPTGAPSSKKTGRFAGTWSGMVPFKDPFVGGGGNQQCDFVINAEENSMIIRLGKAGGGSFHTATTRLVVIGNTATGKGGFLKHMNATLTLTNDPNTATMVVHDTIWGTTSGTVKRIK
jgi:hypothetical protein